MANIQGTPGDDLLDYAAGTTDVMIQMLLKL
jgi:hypothetical protein